MESQWADQKKSHSNKKHVYLITAQLGNISSNTFIINSVFEMEEQQILELCDEILNDRQKEFVENSILEMNSEDIKDGKDVIIKTMKPEKEIEYQYLGFISSFNLNEKSINVTATDVSRRREIGS